MTIEAALMPLPAPPRADAFGAGPSRSSAPFAHVLSALGQDRGAGPARTEASADAAPDAVPDAPGKPAGGTARAREARRPGGPAGHARAAQAQRAAAAGQGSGEGSGEESAGTAVAADRMAGGQEYPLPRDRDDGHARGDRGPDPRGDAARDLPPSSAPPAGALATLPRAADPPGTSAGGSTPGSVVQDGTGPSATVATAATEAAEATEATAASGRTGAAATAVTAAAAADPTPTAPGAHPDHSRPARPDAPDGIRPARSPAASKDTLPSIEAATRAGMAIPGTAESRAGSPAARDATRPGLGGEALAPASPDLGRGAAQALPPTSARRAGTPRGDDELRSPGAQAAARAQPERGAVEPPGPGAGGHLPLPAVVERAAPGEPAQRGEAAAAQATFSAALQARTDATGDAGPDAPTRTYPITVPVHDARFPDAISERVTWLVREGLQSAELTLDPRELGPIRIELSLSGDAASIGFVVAQAETRSAIEQALPRLREMLAGQGLQLGGAQIDAGRGGSDGGQPRRRDARADASAPLATGASAAPTIALPPGGGRPVRPGRIDLFA